LHECVVRGKRRAQIEGAGSGNDARWREFRAKFQGRQIGVGCAVEK